jgi:hypothetical protein
MVTQLNIPFIHSRRLGLAAIVVACHLVLLPGILRGQEGRVGQEPELVERLPSRILQNQPFVGRFGETPYMNFGFKNYSRLPEFSSNLTYHYNDLGDPLLYGTQLVNWAERRGLGVQRGYSAVGEGGGHGETTNAYRNLFGNVIIGSDGTDSWQSKFIYGDEIRSSLTPLTMKLSNMNGLRVDVATKLDNFSLMLSTLPWAGQTGQGPGVNGSPSPRVPTMMLSSHYQRKIGFLNVSGTFLNIHQYEPLMASRFESLKGTPGAIQTAPAMVALRILDDSPQDGRGGPVLHDVRVYVDGELHPELEPFIVHLNKRRDERQVYMAPLKNDGTRFALPSLRNYALENRGAPNSGYNIYININPVDPELWYRGYEFPFFIDHLFYRDFKLNDENHVVDDKGTTVRDKFAYDQAESSGDYLGLSTMADLPQAFDGETYGILYVDLESIQQSITSVEIELTLANDYRVEMSQIPISGSTETPPGRNHAERYRYASFFRTVARADGNPQDGTPEKVRIKVGAPTGLRLASASVNGVFKGFQINGEFARSTQYQQYISGIPGPRVPLSAQFPTLDALSVSAFQREQAPGARGTISDNSYYLTVQRGFDRWDVGGELFSMGPLYTTEFRSYLAADEFNLNGNPVAYNNTLLHRMVEDNDDNDRYPDSWYANFDKKQAQMDIDGVFPGLDADSDGIPDTNRNLNREPDYLEPFLMYDADPQEFDYGADVNHNDFIDSRENDWEADLPYDPDLGGLHLYGSYKPLPGLKLTLGSMDAEQNAGALPSESLYSRMSYGRQVPTIGLFFSELSVERIRDGVEDHLSVYSDQVLTLAEQKQIFSSTRNQAIAPFREEIRLDSLNYRNSTFTRLFAEARWQAVPHLNMHNKVKFEINHQHGGELFDHTVQASDRQTRWTMAHKIDYDWEIAPNLTLFSGFKFRYHKQWRRTLELPDVHERHLIPLMKLNYRLTSRTRFQLGAQGITSKLPYRVTDLARPEENFEQRDTVLMMTNLSKYFGYIISTNAGVRHRLKKFEDPAVDAIRGERFTAVFINAILGFEED